MAEFIITLDPKEVFDFKGKSLGMQDKLALHFSPQIGRKRIYRNSLKTPQKGQKLLVYKRKSSAERVCAEINQVYQSDFKVESKTSTNL